MGWMWVGSKNYIKPFFIYIFYYFNYTLKISYVKNLGENRKWGVNNNYCTKY